jgi:predicted RNA-binding protein (virulence factor B family)
MEISNIIIGKTYSLRVNRFVEFGCYLDALNLGEILMPKRYFPEGLKENDEVEVFVYRDSEDRLIATTEKPYIQVGMFAPLKVVSVSNAGAFMDMGLTKDLLVPHSEQYLKMNVGETHVVFAYVDADTDRIAGSSKLKQFLPLEPPHYQTGEEVDIMVCQTTPLGYKVLIEFKHWGMLYFNQIFTDIQIGDQHKAYITKVRTDDKIDLSLTPHGGEHIDDVARMIYKELEKTPFIALHDKSSSEEIKDRFQVSKKAFKKAIGALYKNRLIVITEEGISLVRRRAR